MVYNDVLYRPASLSERLQAKFGDRAATAVYRAVSSDYTATAENKARTSEVLSFFGRIDDTRTADRAIPSKRRTIRSNEPLASANRGARTRGNTAQARPAQARSTAQARSAQQTARPTAKASPEIAGTFARAYAAGTKARAHAASAAATPRRQYAKGAAPTGSLRRGRSNIPGARHAVLVTGDTADDRRNPVKIMRDAFSDRHVAEHRVKKAPLPVGFLTLICICAFMVMVLLFSFSQIHEYNNNIGDLKDTQAALDERASKLEVQLEERDDIRQIEQIALEDIGMVSSDMVQSKFVSVAGADRVEVMKTEEEEEEGGFSAILSVIGENLGKLGEYFG